MGKYFVRDVTKLRQALCDRLPLVNLDGKFWNLDHLLYIDVDGTEPLFKFVDGSTVTHDPAVAGLVGDLVAAGALRVTRYGTQEPYEATLLMDVNPGGSDFNGIAVDTVLVSTVLEDGASGLTLETYDNYGDVYLRETAAGTKYIEVEAQAAYHHLTDGALVDFLPEAIDFEDDDWIVQGVSAPILGTGSLPPMFGIVDDAKYGGEDEAIVLMGHNGMYMNLIDGSAGRYTFTDTGTDTFENVVIRKVGTTVRVYKGGSLSDTYTGVSFDAAAITDYFFKIGKGGNLTAPGSVDMARFRLWKGQMTDVNLLSLANQSYS